jgi:hypothetical protein
MGSRKGGESATQGGGGGSGGAVRGRARPRTPFCAGRGGGARGFLRLVLLLRCEAAGEDGCHKNLFSESIYYYWF